MSLNVVAVALGSNLGDRRAHLDYALERLRLSVSDLRASSIHETEPVGVEPQSRFLNAAAVGLCELGPHAFLAELLAIERERGRQRPFPGAPRTLDLDLILFGHMVVSDETLVVPHPRFRKRRFVLEPLAEIAPDMVDPVTGLSIVDLLRSDARAS